MSDNTLRIGSVLHGPKRDYTVKNVLGQGGFGITYLVEGKVRVDNILVDAKFAVKEFFISSLCWRDDSQRLAYSKSQSDIISRSLRAFVREADRLKSLNINHPNLLNINEVFEANGTAYYVMEYLNGGSLAQYIKQRGRLSWDETVALCKPIVDAVALLHTNQVTHYDIKPQNIMLVQDGNALRPVLIDFGLAKHYDAQGNATSTGLSGGYTPGYAPVEQYHGIRSFQPTADVYALAATIYHCLTGHAPAAAELLDLDAVSDELLDLNVSDEAVNILLQALDLRPTKRPATAAALTAALFTGAPLQTVRKPHTGGGGTTDLNCGYAGGTTTQAKIGAATTPESPTPQTRKRWLVPAVAAAAVALAAIIFFATRGGGDTTLPATDTIRIASTDTVRVEYAAEPAQQPSTANFRTTPRNLDLQVIYNGEKYYFSVDEWRSLSRSERSSLDNHKCGVVINYNDVEGRRQQFVVKLELERHASRDKVTIFDSTEFTWYGAKHWVNNMSGNWRLPTKEECEAMASQYEAVCNAIKAFGGDEDLLEFCYWTSTTYEKDSSSAWCFHLANGGVFDVNKSTNTGVHVRAVRAI